MKLRQATFSILLAVVVVTIGGMPAVFAQNQATSTVYLPFLVGSAALATPTATPTATIGVPFPTSTPTPTSTSTPTNTLTASASMSNPTPLQRTIETVSASLTDSMGHGVAGATMHADWYYKTVTSTCDGLPTDASGLSSCSRDISSATIGYKVVVTVTLTYNGQPYVASTSFTPQ